LRAFAVRVGVRVVWVGAGWAVWRCSGLYIRALRVDFRVFLWGEAGALSLVLRDGLLSRFCGGFL